MNPSDPPSLKALNIRVQGRVQGVGFRPFIYRLAQRFGLTGWVQNLGGEVEIRLQGAPSALAAFQQALTAQAPPLARPAIKSLVAVSPQAFTDFRILSSAHQDKPDIHVPPDYFTCGDCLQELHDPIARRYRYPFINCTQCGPRYTIIRALPYDRPNTTLADFALCPDCLGEYRDPADRRFHAQPLACPACGPQLQFRDAHGEARREAALAACLAALRAGSIVAVKGVGGYHLMCDATQDGAVQRLRERKRRPDKPLAVMFPPGGEDGLAVLREYVQWDDAAASRLIDPSRPIVLVARRPDSKLAKSLAPGLEELGVFLPYSPLHHLLLGDLQQPLVATSGNLSGEPVITDPAEATDRLKSVADAFLHHDRPIERPADDAVYRIIAGTPRPIRLGRGVAPLELRLEHALGEPVLALGGHQKVTLALAWDNRVVVSPHVGDLDSPRALAVFERIGQDLQRLYGVGARRLICDAHPGYAGTRWAKRQSLPVLPVYHHHAHASGLVGEFPGIEPWLICTWDGVGYGADGTLWGGEILWGKPGDWRQVAGFRRFRLPGGDRAGREPWRAAAALCWEAGLDWQNDALPDLALARHAWERGLNSPFSSAVGRLFDAAAAWVLGRQRTSFEGQGPMLLEALASTDAECSEYVELPLDWDEVGVLRADWSPLLPLLIDIRRPAARRAAIFHNSLAECLAQQVLKLRERFSCVAVGLTGGVFQNRRLAEHALRRLEALGIQAHLPTWTPVNDGGLSFGQVVEAAALLSSNSPEIGPSLTITNKPEV
ncbi:MAG: carbamoyltransferase HypF [Gammaproteobacteria bacterium]|nr:carbamoyltransferase HypF [Gammaproteobacteria bacterium]MCP5425430.1 carbamoyltransferase HypF [Gammaproteobacteria bacterium]MCP5459779.1 carbamoyltransferase HypF [Gammaproteobacteria bacterium]